MPEMGKTDWTVEKLIEYFYFHGSTEICFSCAIYQECYDAWHVEPSCGGWPPDWMDFNNPDESPEIDIFEKVKTRGNCYKAAL